MPRVAPEGIFDAFGWCASDWLEWRSPAAGESTGRAPWDATTRIDGGDPARMVFVLRGDAAPYLPHELAGMHAFGLGLTHERALAPWAIDDATDGLHAHGTRPHEALWLAADNLNALFWGLHDWAHFHNHGPFEPHQRAWTELQCDVTALVWLWINRQQVPLSDAGWERIRHEVADLSRRRFEDEGAPFDASLLEAGRVHELAGDWERTARS